MTKRIWLHLVNSMDGGVGRVVENLVSTGIDGCEQRICELERGGFSLAGSAIRKMAAARSAIYSLPSGSLVHLHCGFRSWVYAAPIKGIRYIATIHGIVPPSWYGALLSKAELYLLSKRVGSIVAVSEHCKNTMRKMAGLLCPIPVIPNGVPSAWTNSPPRTNSLVTVAFVGDFSWNKGIHIFLEVARLLKHVQARFFVFGKGPEGVLVEKMANEGLVRWVDNETDPAKLYSQIDILVFPSRFEGCPMVILEAMSHGVVTVSSNIPAVREIIENGRDGIMIDSWEARDYADAVERLITGGDKRLALSECARNKWASHFSADLMARGYSLLASNLSY